MSPDRPDKKSASQPAQETDRRVSDEMNRTSQTAAELTERTARQVPSLCSETHKSFSRPGR